MKFEADKNGQQNGHTKSNGPNTRQHEAYNKEFKHRESLLTVLINDNSHIQTLHNLVVALVGMLTISTLGDYVLNPKRFSQDYNLFLWNLSHFFPHIWIILSVFHLVVFALLYPLVRYRFWLQCEQLKRNIRHRLDENKKNDTKLDEDQIYEEELAEWTQLPRNIRIGLDSFYLTIVFAGLVGVCSWYITSFNIRIAASFGITMELCRMLMKSHSYYVEKSQLRIDKIHFHRLLHSIEKGRADVDEHFATSRPIFSQFLYFLFAPTLIYRDSYPRTQTIRWRFVVSHAVQFVVVVLLIYLSICRILIDNYSSTGQQSFNSHQIFSHLTTVFVFGIILFFLIFYGFLHLWHNLTAELLQFGDRHFYEAWWVSASFKEYYRKWNLLVQEWLFTYVYYPVYNWSHSRVTAQYATIVFSGLAHEYILFHSTKFFFPLLFFNFAIGGFVLYLITPKKVRNREVANFQNIVFLVMNMFGWGVISVLYSIEWYSRVNCPIQTNSTETRTWMPRMMSCIKIH